VGAAFYFKPWEKLSGVSVSKAPWQTIAIAVGAGVVLALLWLKIRSSRGHAADGTAEGAAPVSPLLRVMVALNAPLLRLAPSTRNLVGWVGLLTLFNGSMLMMGRAVFHITGGSPSAAVAADGHGSGGGHGAASGHGDAHGKKDDGHGAKKADAGHGDSHGAKPKPKAKKPDPKKPAANAKKPGAKKADAHGGGH